LFTIVLIEQYEQHEISGFNILQQLFRLSVTNISLQFHLKCFYFMSCTVIIVK